MKEVVFAMTFNQGKCFKDVPTYQKGFHDDSFADIMPYSKFGDTDMEVSLLGFGGSQLALLHKTTFEKEGIDTVVRAVKSGINYIDTAPYYGQGKAEIVLGKALKYIPRNAYYLATKVGRYGAVTEPQNMFDFSGERTEKSICESLSRLGVDYIDVMQVHDVEYATNADIIVKETLPVLQKYKDMGKIKYIGVTGYSLSKLKEVLEKSTVKVDAVLSYCRCTLFDDSLRSYISYFKESKLGIINAAVVGMGLLTDGGPPEWHPAKQEMKKTCQQAVEYCKDHNVDIAKIAACHSFDQPDINTHLIGMQNFEVLKSNLKSLSEGLSDFEEKVKNYTVTQYFKQLSETHWENIEVNIYWENLKKLDLL